MNFRGRVCEPSNGVYVEISMNLNDQYRLWTFLICITEQSVNHHLREFNIPQKKH